MILHSLALLTAFAAQSLSYEIPLFDHAVDYYNPLTGGGSMLDDAGKYQITHE